MSETISTKFVFRAADKGPEQLQLSVWNGKLDIAVFPGSGGPVFKKSMQMSGVVMFADALKSIVDSQPGIRICLVFKHFDKDSKSRVIDGTMIIGKNDKQAIYFECQFMHNGNKKQIMFNVNCSEDVTPSTDPMSEATKSVTQTRAVLLWLNAQVPVAMLMTNKKFEPAQGGGNRGGGSRGDNSYSSNSRDNDFGDTDVAF